MNPAQTQPRPVPARPAAEPLESEAPTAAIAHFLLHASRAELAVAYRALVGLMVGGEELDTDEAQAARQMYQALQRELDRQLHSAIFPLQADDPLPF